jgi:hypothetical protein
MIHLQFQEKILIGFLEGEKDHTNVTTYEENKYFFMILFLHFL